MWKVSYSITVLNFILYYFLPFCILSILESTNIITVMALVGTNDNAQPGYQESVESSAASSASELKPHFSQLISTLKVS